MVIDLTGFSSDDDAGNDNTDVPLTQVAFAPLHSPARASQFQQLPAIARAAKRPPLQPVMNGKELKKKAKPSSGSKIITEDGAPPPIPLIYSVKQDAVDALEDQQRDGNKCMLLDRTKKSGDFLPYRCATAIRYENKQQTVASGPGVCPAFVNIRKSVRPGETQWKITAANFKHINCTGVARLSTRAMSRLQATRDACAASKPRKGASIAASAKDVRDQVGNRSGVKISE